MYGNSVSLRMLLSYRQLQRWSSSPHGVCHVLKWTSSWSWWRRTRQGWSPHQRLCPRVLSSPTARHLRLSPWILSHASVLMQFQVFTYRSSSHPAPWPPAWGCAEIFCPFDRRRRDWTLFECLHVCPCRSMGHQVTTFNTQTDNNGSATLESYHLCGHHI